MAYRSAGSDMPLSVALFLIGLFVASAIGWVMNVIKLIGLLGGDVTAMFIARCVAVFVMPLGAILGWF